MTTYPTAIQVHEGATQRESAQTAVNDHTVDLTPGTYPLTIVWDQEMPGRAMYAKAIVPARTRARVESSALFAGVTYATRELPAEDVEAFFKIDGYLLNGFGEWLRKDVTLVY